MPTSSTNLSRLTKSHVQECAWTCFYFIEKKTLKFMSKLWVWIEQNLPNYHVLWSNKEQYEFTEVINELRNKLNGQVKYIY